MQSLLEVENVTICYNRKMVVDNVSFSLQQGEILGIVGESGSGKSTIIKAIMGLLGIGGVITRGDIYYKGKNIVDMPQKERRHLLGPEIGMVFQDCKSAMCPIRTVGEQVYESLSEHEKISKVQAQERVSELMKKIGLEDTERILKSYPFELSGGMNQRVGICTAMMMHPSLLLADEPTSALDVTVQAQVVEEMKLMRKEYNTSIILVSHNIGVVEAMADKILVLKNGIIMDYGQAKDVLKASKNEYTKELMSAVLHLKRINNG